MLMTGLAWADDISNDLDASIDAVAESIEVSMGDDAAVGLYVQPRNADGKNGCNLTGTTTLVVSVASSDTGVATVSPSSIEFGSCGDLPEITVHGVAVGTSTISLSLVSNDSEGTFDLAPATFSVTVTSLGDVTPPTITITTPVDGAVYLLNEVVLADYACQDEAGGSGLASCAGTVADGAQIDTATVGAKTFTVNAADNAGNTATLTHNYSVVYDFAGFFQPVENPDAWNKAKAGQGVPVKFSLDGDQGLAIFKSGSPTAVQVACPSGTGTTYDAIETTTANSSGLIYDADAGQYVYVWKTPKTLDGKCYKFKLGLNDGSSWYALFDFRK
jgi:hypothetical protein